MKFFSGASLVGLLATGLADAIGTKAPFTITKFNAGATPHSSVGYVELTWSYSNGLNSTTCSARPGTYQVFPSVEKTVCSDPFTSFNLTKRSDGGADLELWYQEAYAIHTISADQIVWTNQQSPTGTVQVYAGPQNFTVKANYPET
ncbi:uncharacterized protein F4812DRAFT_118769 [Daldinia caldariorum]|uniref:uncharacterized protein n=1 Tax=Daldinia caldariorum TaxID=326644 RepID=UPI0020078E14|nr:uncharacterized protein F4812DRAFT_118769 [Daldinia caldariorum]KAI1465346.1 hypothetical protein F4812DRAFT_118769 [Daldinia caldariorum]